MLLRTVRLQVHQEFGAGLEVSFLPNRGYLVEAIAESPGQTELLAGDIIVASGGRSLAIRCEDTADELLAAELVDGVELLVLRDEAAADEAPAAVADSVAGCSGAASGGPTPPSVGVVLEDEVHSGEAAAAAADATVNESEAASGSLASPPMGAGMEDGAAARRGDAGSEPVAVVVAAAPAGALGEDAAGHPVDDAAASDDEEFAVGGLAAAAAVLAELPRDAEQAASPLAATDGLGPRAGPSVVLLPVAPPPAPSDGETSGWGSPVLEGDDSGLEVEEAAAALVARAAALARAPEASPDSTVAPGADTTCRSSRAPSDSEWEGLDFRRAARQSPDDPRRRGRGRFGGIDGDGAADPGAPASPGLADPWADGAAAGSPAAASASDVVPEALDASSAAPAALGADAMSPGVAEAGASRAAAPDEGAIPRPGGATWSSWSGPDQADVPNVFRWPAPTPSAAPASSSSSAAVPPPPGLEAGAGGRGAAGGPPPPAAAPAAGAALCKVQDLAEWLAQVSLLEYFDAASEWCMEMGAVSLEEVAENIVDFAEGVGLKPIERQRVQKWAASLLRQGRSDDWPADFRHSEHAALAAHAAPSQRWEVATRGHQVSSRQPPGGSASSVDALGSASSHEAPPAYGARRAVGAAPAKAEVVYEAQSARLVMDSHGGTGLELSWDPDWGILVQGVDPLPGQIGLAAGDYIVAIEGQSLRQRGHEECNSIFTKHLRNGAALSIISPTTSAGEASGHGGATSMAGSSKGPPKGGGKGSAGHRAPLRVGYHQPPGQRRGGYDANRMWSRFSRPVW